MGNSTNTVLTKQELLFVLKSFAVLYILVAIFDDCIITLSSDAESRGEQDGGKHPIVGQTNSQVAGRF